MLLSKNVQDFDIKKLISVVLVYMITHLS